MRLIDRLKASALAKRAVPLFPIGCFTPNSTSAFVGVPPEYTDLVCMVTHRCGAKMQRIADADDRGPRPDDEQDQRPPAKFKPKGTKPCVESPSPARGAASRSTLRSRTRGTKG